MCNVTKNDEKKEKRKILSSAGIVNGFLHFLSGAYKESEIDGLTYEAGIANFMATKGLFVGDDISKQ